MKSPVSLVTGGTRGIGFGIAMALAREGHALAICGMREASQCADTIESLRADSPDVQYYSCDVSDAGQRDAMLGGIREHFGGLTTLVNNAGVAPTQRADILDATEESFERLIRINLQGPYFLTQAVARWMIEQRESDPEVNLSIITVSSISSTVASVNRGDYCISKAGLSMMSSLWAARLAEHNILAYEVRPGVIATDMTSGVKDKYDKLIADGLIPQPRWGEPDDIGKAVASLARGDFPYSTGAVITIDGGLTINRL
ncbi:MAG: 3-ketoacyl-ACP reductase [Verrucomicrobia bacterium]|nr:3-ketoacyl-ACP reductase [Verrucomicrobiota bacterium]MDA1086285.1 3-ketoacyl-ACP reductase [Verrucomicrobiota bacterium]